MKNALITLVMLMFVSFTYAQDSKVRLFVTDEPVNFASLIAVSHHQSSISGSSSGSISGNAAGFSGSSSGSFSGQSSGGSAAYGKHDQGPNARTVEIQADLMNTCPNITVTNDVTKANFVLLFRRANGHRESMFAMGGLAGLALSSAMKVDGASLFESTGDMVYAIKAKSVKAAIKEVCGHVPTTNLPTPIAYMSQPVASAPAPVAAPAPIAEAPTPVAVAPTTVVEPAAPQATVQTVQFTQPIATDDPAVASRRIKQHKACLELAQSNPSITCN